MKTLITFLCVVVLNTNIFSQTDLVRVSQDGVVVVEFNAGWNTAKYVPWVKNLNDCKTNRYGTLPMESRAAVCAITRAK